MPIASTILMVRPAAFGFNEETAATNPFQTLLPVDPKELHRKAVGEFDEMVKVLRSHGIMIYVIDDTPEPAKPDALFPNNWFCTLTEGVLAVFPLYAPSRREEKRKDILDRLMNEFKVSSFQDWSKYEAEQRFLEGTGSMVIDHENKMIYSTISERTSVSVLENFSTTNNFQAIVFISTDKNGYPVYHTNVVMSLGDEFAVLCEESIDEEWELIAVRQLLESTGHVIIPINREQMHAFAGNIIQLKNDQDEKFIVISQTALDALKKEQLRMLEAFGTIVPIAIPTIEQVEGGSVRCMIAEIFLDRK